MRLVVRRGSRGGGLRGLDDLRHGELAVDPGQDGDRGGAGEGREQVLRSRCKGESGQQLDPAPA